jgi:hypothetical protein
MSVAHSNARTLNINENFSEISAIAFLHKSSKRPPYGGFYNELAKSMTSFCSANTLAEFIMSLQNI